MQEFNPKDSNKPSVLSSIGYEINIHAAAPSQKDLALLKWMWVAYGSCFALGASLSLWLLWHMMGSQNDFFTLMMILASSTCIACAGLIFWKSYSCFGGVRWDGAPNVDAVDLACQENPVALAYRAEVEVQKRSLTIIEAQAILRSSGLEYINSEEAPPLLVWTKTRTVAFMGSKPASNGKLD